MTNTPTPHNRANYGDFAKTVIMPGDPLRAKYIAENFLDDAILVTDVRNMLGYTGTYKGKRVSVMGHGMGMPSAGIYTHELFNFYGVETIIRIGTAGAVGENTKVGDVIIAQAACTDSNYMSTYHLRGTFAPIADFELSIKAYEKAKELGIAVTAGNVLSKDHFYEEYPEENKAWANFGVIAMEMEIAAVYAEALRAGKKAVAMVTVSDNPFTGEGMSAEERQTSLHDMIQIALEIA